MSKGFTLVELLIVIAVMILLFSVAVPGIGKLLNAGREDSSIGSLGAAIATARSYAGRNPPMPPGVTYEGTALIVTPANELRVVEHFNNEFVGGAGGGNFNLYRDTIAQVHQDVTKQIREGYISVPHGVGLVGIARNSATAPLLLTPPFALRFDQNGHLIVRMPGPNGSVVYDGSYEQNMNLFDNYESGNSIGAGTHERRPDDYDPLLRWDPERSGKVPGTSANRDTLTSAVNFHEAQQKYMMQFETLETVIGVIAFNKEEVRKQFGDDALIGRPTGTAFGGIAGNLRTDVAQWLLENGRVMFFNRYSGAVIKP